MQDSEREQRVRQALATGAVAEACEWADSIEDVSLRRALHELIRDYESV